MKYLVRLFLTIWWGLMISFKLILIVILNVCYFLWHLSFKFELEKMEQKDWWLVIEGEHAWRFQTGSMTYYKSLKDLWRGNKTIIKM